jgi:type II secretory ATPase GspE/PulE/Tfp pilus assembly ATPase PilB-like protein
MQIPDEKLSDLLVKPGHVSKERFLEAQTEAEESGESIEKIIVDKGLIKDKELGKLLAEDAGFIFVDLSTVQVDEEVLSLVPEFVARKSGVIAYSRDSKGVNVGMMDPADLEIRQFLEKRLGNNIVPHAITQRGFQDALTRYKVSLETGFTSILERLQDDRLSQEERDTVTIEMVDTLLSYGYLSQVSDIHIEPYEDQITVRFRIDGVLHDVLDISKKYADLILTRIKIMSRMRTDEHRSAQDGKFRFTTPQGESADVRVSIVPVVEGENVVMRILSANNRQFSLTDLGLSSGDLAKVEKAIDNPHGMVLTTGPTGSGKTTTVYAVLKILNIREVHISTIENPVEYDIEGISQIQVDTKTNLTFANGLRAIVRQDPDIIMVGEIRDKETASIATNSAMTGHLVLSTLHANDAATTLARLLDMGVEPFLVVSTVNVVIAQRLVRKICNSCRVSANLTEEEKRAIERDAIVVRIFTNKGTRDLDALTVYHGTGCKACGSTGYEGRIGIFEVLEMTDAIKDLVVSRSSSDQISETAEREGMTIMLEDGVAKVLTGITTVEEVLRVTKG